MEPIVDSLGLERFMGDLGFATRPNRPWDVYGTSGATPVVPRDEWVATTFANLPLNAPTTIKDQGRTNECNAFACCYALEGVRRVSGGQDIPLSPGFIYGHINHGFDNGSQLEDGLDFVQRVGTVPATVVAELEWRRFPPTAEALAQKYRVLEWWLCPSFDLMASAVHNGFPVVFGIPWGVQDGLDPQGWLPEEPAGGLAGGHAMCAFALAKRGRRWGLLTVNSWTRNWGRDGWLVVPEGRFENQMFGGGAWACRVVTSSDADNLPVLGGS